MKHSVSWRFSLVSLRLLLSSVLSHLMKKNLILSHLTKKKSDSVSSHKKKSSSVSSHWKKIQFCFISSKKNWFCFISSKKNLVLFWFCFKSESEQNRKFWFWQSVYSLKWMKEDKVVIISHYHSYVSQNQKILSHSDSVLSHFIKKKLILSHLIKKKSHSVLILTVNI